MQLVVNDAPFMMILAALLPLDLSTVEEAEAACTAWRISMVVGRNPIAGKRCRG